MRLARSPALPRSTDAPTPWSRPDRSRDQWNGRRHNAPILVERSRSERSSHDKAIWAVILTCALALAACSPPHHDRRQQQHCNETLVEPRNEWIRRRRRRGILTHGLRRHARRYARTGRLYRAKPAGSAHQADVRPGRWIGWRWWGWRRRYGYVGAAPCLSVPARAQRQRLPYTVRASVVAGRANRAVAPRRKPGRAAKSASGSGTMATGRPITTRHECLCEADSERRAKAGVPDCSDG
jgi:hypothetical protein